MEHIIEATQAMSIKSNEAGNHPIDISLVRHDHVHGSTKYTCEAGHTKNISEAEYLAHMANMASGSNKKESVYKCNICDILNNLKRHDSETFCKQTVYNSSQTRFEFVCSQGHRTITDYMISRRGCRSCVLLLAARKRHNAGNALMMDTKCLNTDSGSYLRFHCNKYRHDTKCENPICRGIREKSIVGGADYSPDCTNFRPCDQDFYATPSQLLSSRDDTALNCNADHYFHKQKIVLYALRLFESIFDKRFDDDTYHYGVRMTGYNAELKLGFTHMAHLDAALCVEIARSWCAENGVTFITVDKHLVQSGRAHNNFVRQLIYHGRIVTPNVQRTVLQMRKKVKDQDRFFTERCMFDLNKSGGTALIHKVITVPNEPLEA